MDKYYYLISQLPTLVFDRDNAINVDQFLEEAEKWVSKRDLQLLMKAVLNRSDEKNDYGHPVWKAYYQIEHIFRKEIGLWRRSHIDGTDYKPDSFSPVLLKEGNPLEIEKKLLSWRWNYLEEQEKDHHFDLGFLILYFLKLQILQKLAVFNKEKGLETFQKISKVTV